VKPSAGSVDSFSFPRNTENLYRWNNVTTIKNETTVASCSPGQLRLPGRKFT